MEAWGVNFILSVLTRVIVSVADLPKPVPVGADPPMHSDWKFLAITRMLKSSFNGHAFTSFILCYSQAELNSGESYYTLKFGKDPARLRARVVKLDGIPLKQLISEQKKKLVENEKSLESLMRTQRRDPKNRVIREQMIKSCQDMIHFYESF